MKVRCCYFTACWLSGSEQCSFYRSNPGQMLKQKRSHYLLALLSLILFIVIGYGIERHQTSALFLCYFSLFALYVLLLNRARLIEESELSFWIFACLLFRAVLL